MNQHERIGEITTYTNQKMEWEIAVYWKIHDFLSQTSCFDSPEFGSPHGRFFMRMYPNWMNDPSSDWVRLDFCRDDLGSTRILKVTLGFVGPNGWLEKERQVEREFGNVDFWHSVDFCQRSQLIDQESRLMPENILTIKCGIKSVDYNFKCMSSFDDASVQTDSNLTGLVDLATGSQTSHEQAVSSFSEASTQTQSNPSELLALTICRHIFEASAEDDDDDGEDCDDEDEDDVEDDEVEECENKDDEASSSETKKTKKVSLPARHGGVICSLKAIQAEGRRADFTLKSGSREWRVHKVILESGNDCFAVKFGQEWSESTAGKLPSEDIKEDALESLMQFIYTGEVEGLSVDNVCGVYAAADWYRSLDLRSMCVEYMKDNMCVETVCDALAVAETYGEEDFGMMALKCFFLETNRVFDTEGWKRLKQDHPSIISKLLKETLKRRRESRGEC